MRQVQHTAKLNVLVKMIQTCCNFYLKIVCSTKWHVKNYLDGPQKPACVSCKCAPKFFLCTQCMGNHVIDPTARDKLDAFYTPAEEESDDQEAIDDEDK